MTDRELLELAAKASGIPLKFGGDWHNVGCPHVEGGSWNPIYDDGDALRLAVALDIGITFCFHRQTVTAGRWHAIHEHRIVPFGQDKEAATRLAVVRSAAAIGREMP